MDKKSVGIVETKYFEIDEEVSLECGKKLKKPTIAYETYGKLNEDKSNAILIFHALSGDAHVAGYHTKDDKKPGWWDSLIGPWKTVDTKKYFVICTNVIGGCKGSTGPSSINPDNGKEYGINFPMITIKDMVVLQKKLIDNFGIKKLFAVIGGSMGGMQTLEWITTFPKSAKLVIPIATASQQSAQNIGFHEVGRQAIVTDADWRNGDYYGKSVPKAGLSVARMIGHITYLSEASMKKKFGRKLRSKEKLDFTFNVEFEIESYLRYQADSFVKRFDANSYLYISKAIDYFDLTDGGKITLEKVFEEVDAKFLVISYKSDWLYSPVESKKIVQALQRNWKEVISIEIDSEYGHDAFLLKNNKQESVIKNFLDNNFKE